MYSHEDHIRAVKLYIKLGKRTGPTILQLGYPIKNALKSRHRDYKHSRDLQMGYVRSKQKYSDQQKHAAVQHYVHHDHCIASAMKALRWAPASMKPSKDSESVPEKTQLTALQ